MADTVQYLLEEMIPELEDLEKRGLFSRAEIKQIVKKRTHFEYLLKRRATLKTDFVRYIHYETKLDELRRHRKKQQGEDAVHGLGDTGGIRRLHFIFQRCVKKFRGDLQLWMKYFKFCRACGGHKRLDQALTDALNFHPNESGLWAYAAAWELEHRQDADAARALMLRGLRNCKHSERLWHEYFRMELVYANKLRERRRVLELDAPAPEVTEEEDGEDAVKLARNRERIMNGAVAILAYRKSIEALPQSSTFRLGFLKVLESFDGFKEVEDAVLSNLASDFPLDEGCWDYRARFHLASADETSREETITLAIQVYLDALHSVPTAKMYELTAAFFKEQIAETLLSRSPGSQTPDDLRTHLLKIFSRAADGSVYSGRLTLDHALLLRELGRSKEAERVLKTGCSLNPADPQVWQVRIQIRFHSVMENGGTEAELQGFVKLCGLALRSVPREAATPLWIDVLRLLALCAQEVDGNRLPFARVFQLLESSLTLTSAELGEVTAAAIEWLALLEGIESARHLYRRLLALPRPALALYRSCIRIEIAAGASGDGRRARELLDAATDLYGSEDANLWLQFLQYEHAATGAVGK
eukprot:gene12564-14848_t